jgi:predicted outer membrane repeat protein
MYRLFALVVIVLLLPEAAAGGRVWTVDAGGGGDVLTIKAGMDSAAAGDSVRVTSGIYNEHDILMKSGVVLHSQTYSPVHCTIDAEGLGRVMLCDGVDATGEIRGITFKGGHAAGTGVNGSGGGIACVNSSSPVISTCYFQSNTAGEYGGAIYCEGSSSPPIQFCSFHNNEAGTGGGALCCRTNSEPYVYKGTFVWNSTSGDGGGVYCDNGSALTMVNCTLLNNAAAGSGGGLFSVGSSQPTLASCLVSFSQDGEGVWADDDNSIAWCGCTDIYGNEDGDWVGRIAGQEGTLGNFSADPLYCDTSFMGVTLEDCSPCMTGYHPDGYDCGTTIGSAIGYGCNCGEATKPSTWGSVKALYR